MVDRNLIDNIDFGNSMITDFSYGSSDSGSNGKSANAQFIGDKGGNINVLNGATNKPIGITYGTEVLQRTLKNDYPALKDGSSLSYLFVGGTYADKQNTKSIEGLFQRNEESGAYFYNSRENHAQYSDNKFTLYNQIITPNFIVYPFGNFLPFNVIDDAKDATQVGAFNYSGGAGDYIQSIIDRLEKGSDYSRNSTKQQLADMLIEYRENWKKYKSIADDKTWSNFSAGDAIKDYFLGDSDGNGDKPSIISF